jgi:hypothetical protein
MPKTAPCARGLEWVANASRSQRSFPFRNPGDDAIDGLSMARKARVCALMKQTLIPKLRCVSFFAPVSFPQLVVPALIMNETQPNACKRLPQFYAF